MPAFPKTTRRPAPTTLEELAARVEAIEDLQDQINPNILSLGPKGEVNATLTGFLKAHGIQLQESKGAGFPESEIVWQYEAATGAFVRAYRQAGSNRIDVATLSPDLSKQALIALEASNTFESVIASCTGAALRTIVDSEGRSHFMQVGGVPQRRKIFEGTGVVEWGGASEESNPTTITVPGAGPTYMNPILTSQFRAGFAALQTEPVPGEFTVVMWDVAGVPPAGAKEAFRWIAITD
jgi:hypothetical protein